jgi:hypothetical protein
MVMSFFGLTMTISPFTNSGIGQQQLKNRGLHLKGGNDCSISANYLQTIAPISWRDVAWLPDARFSAYFTHCTGQFPHCQQIFSINAVPIGDLVYVSAIL